MDTLAYNDLSDNFQTSFTKLSDKLWKLNTSFEEKAKNEDEHEDEGFDFFLQG